MQEISNKTLALLLFVAIVASLFSLFVSLNKITSLREFSGITGFVTPNATANVTINAIASMYFSDNSIDFGGGYVNGTVCEISTLGENSPNGLNGNAGGGYNFSVVQQGFVLENTGSANLSVQLMSNKNAEDFIGHASAVFEWNVTQGEASSCLNATGTTINLPWINISGAPFEAVDKATSQAEAKVICQNFQYVDASDTLNISINISIPQGAPAGAKTAEITAIGTTFVG